MWTKETDKSVRKEVGVGRDIYRKWSNSESLELENEIGVTLWEKNLVSSCKVAHGRGTTNREANTAHRKDEGNGKQIEEGKKLSSIYYVSDTLLSVFTYLNWKWQRARKGKKKS